MLYRLFRNLILSLFRAPAEPPDPPAGSPESVQVFRASPRFLTLQLIPFGFGALVALAGVAVAISVVTLAGAPPEAIAGLIALALFLIFVFTLQYLLIRLDYDMRYYVITDRSLRIRHGAFRIQEHTYTYANIQNLNIHQGPLERILGIANVTIETAGGGSAAARTQAGQTLQHGGALRGVDNAEAIRDRILSLLRVYRDAGLGDAPSRRGPARDGQTATGLSPQSIALLREVRDEIQALGSVL